MADTLAQTLNFIRIHRIHLIFLGLLLCSLFSTEGWSSSKKVNATIYKGVDISIVLKIFSTAVFQLKQDYETFHWDKSGNDGDGAEQVKVAKTMARSYWGWFGQQETLNGGYFGNGLYLAVDPITTSPYGPAESNWSLLKLTLPKGLKVLNINDTTFSNKLDFTKGFFTEDEIKEFKNILKGFDCEPINTNILRSLFGSGGFYLASNCQGLVKRIFSEILKIDALMYQYQRKDYNSCQSGDPNEFNDKSNYSQSGKAFVILTSHWIDQSNIKFYNKNSTHDEEARIKIQTLFLKNEETYVSDFEKVLLTTQLIKGKLFEILSSNPGFIPQNITSTCDSQNCSLQLKICNSTNDQCENKDLGFYPLFKASDNNFITKEEVARSDGDRGVVYRGGYELLWSNLVGKPKTSNLTEWVKTFIGCNGESPFMEK